MFHDRVGRILSVWSTFKKEIPFEYVSLCIEECDFLDSTYPPQWVDHYTKQDYGKYDYPIIESRQSLIPVYWNSKKKRKLSPIQKKIYTEACDFRIHSGVSLKLPQSSSIVTVSSNDTKFIEYNLPYVIPTLYFLDSVMALSDNVAHEIDIKKMMKSFQKHQKKIRGYGLNPLMESLNYLRLGRLRLPSLVRDREKDAMAEDLMKSSEILNHYMDTVLSLTL